MHIRRVTALIIFVSLTLTSAFAGFSIAIPDRNSPWYQVITTDGDIIALDDDVYYKRWNGLLLDRGSSDGMYTVSEDRTGVTAIASGLDPRHILSTLRLAEPRTIIIPDASPLDPEGLTDYGISHVVSLKRLSRLQEAMYEAKGVTLSYARPGDVLEFENGLPAEDTGPEDTFVVICPRCGEQITVRIPR